MRDCSTRRATLRGSRNSCCHILRIRQSNSLRVLLTDLSRFLFLSSLFSQKARFVPGIPPCFLQPCQKQPSTKTANRAAGKTKSGLPNTFTRRRQPLIPNSPNIRINRSSVASLPQLFTLDIMLERFDLEKTSAIDVPKPQISYFLPACNALRISRAWRCMNSGGRALPIISAIACFPMDGSKT